MNQQREHLEKVSLGIGVMFGLYWMYSIFIQNNLIIHPSIKTIIGLVTLYGVGLFMFTRIIKDIPNYKLNRNKVKKKTVILCFLLQFSAITVMSSVINIFTIASGKQPSIEMNTLTPYMFFMLLIFNPVVEEIVFRKLFADKLLRYGELFYVLASSFCFALVHGVSLGIPQVIYTFLLGLIWSYLVVKTGSIKVSIMLHSLSNLFGSIIIQFLQGISVVAAGLYSILIIVLGVLGLVLLIKNKKNIVLDDKNSIFDQNVLKTIFTNRGIAIYTAFTIVMMILKNI